MHKPRLSARPFPGGPALLLTFLSMLSCGAGTQKGAGPALLASRAATAAPAVAALQAGRFTEARVVADKALAADSHNGAAHLVDALLRYKAATHQFRVDAETVLVILEHGDINQQYLSYALSQAEASLAAVESDLAAAAQEPGVSLELCLACWKVDWNGNGRIDSADEHLFEIEQDADGKPLALDDPQRKPTFRFDVGDVYWARAFVAFQRAFINILSAYRFSDLNALMPALRSGHTPDTVTISLADPQRIAAARKLILEGLEFADRTRREYLAETDDDREWVPNPRQKSHPMPMPVDDRLYQTWAEVVGDLSRLVRGEEGLSLGEVAQLGKHQWDNPPGGYLNFGVLLNRPKDIVIHLRDFKDIDNRSTGPEAALRSILGAAYASNMKPSPLLSRMERMRKEVDRGEESLERKLRYLFWLN